MIEKLFDYFFLFFLLWTNSNQNDLCWKFIFEEIFETNKQSCLNLSHFTTFLCFLQQSTSLKIQQLQYANWEKSCYYVTVTWMRRGHDGISGQRTMDDDERLRPEPGLALEDSWHCTVSLKSPQRLGRGGRHWSTAEASLWLRASVSQFTLTNCGTVYLNWLFVLTLFTVIIGPTLSLTLAK